MLTPYAAALEVSSAGKAPHSQQPRRLEDITMLMCAQLRTVYKSYNLTSVTDKDKNYISTHHRVRSAK